MMTVHQEITKIRALKPDYCANEIYPFVNLINWNSAIDVDLYSRDRELAGLSNISPDWDVDQWLEERVTLKFSNKEEFKRVYRLARLLTRIH
ncbi:MAG: hypothetical protein PV362_04475 [Providencia heimbachae]|nr:hypothetical protein [Providencia heimbachae]